MYKFLCETKEYDPFQYVETNEKIAQASYRTGGGLDKFINAEEKIIELIDGMY